MQERAIAVRRPQALPRRVARNSTLNLYGSGANDGDLDHHARRRLPGPDHSEHHFSAFYVAFGGLQ